MTSDQDDPIASAPGGGDPARSSSASRIEPEMEPALLDWYRAMISRVSPTLGPTGDRGDLQMKAGIEAALGLRRRPSDDARRWLDATCRSLAEREHRGAEGVWSGLIRGGRRMIRQVVGRRPYRDRQESRTSRTRVLHAVADMQIGGAQQLVIDLAMSACRDSPHHVIARSIGIRFRPGLPGSETPGSRRRIERLFYRHRPEVLHLCHYHAGARTAAWYDLVARVAMARGVPIVQSHCVIGDPWLGTDQQHLVFCSEWSRSRSGFAGIPDVVIHPGTPIEIFRAPRRPISADPVVGMVYRLAGDKIDDTAAAAIGCVLREIPKARFEVIGDGPVRPRMERALRDAGLADRVTWRGYVPFSKLASIHRSFDVEIAPVVADTFGSGTVHAIASGTPVVGYGVAALPELLRVDAAIATPESPESIGRKVAAMLGDDALHARVHAAQWTHAASNFGIEAMRSKYHRLFARLAATSA